jgi:cell division protein ZapB
MEAIDKLESGLETLLQTMAALKEENHRLSEEKTNNSDGLEEENNRLKEALEQEKSTKEAVLARIDSLLEKLKTGSDDA